MNVDFNEALARPKFAVLYRSQGDASDSELRKILGNLYCHREFCYWAGKLGFKENPPVLYISRGYDVPVFDEMNILLLNRGFHGRFMATRGIFMRSNIHSLYDLVSEASPGDFFDKSGLVGPIEEGDFTEKFIERCVGRKFDPQQLLKRMSNYKSAHRVPLTREQ